MVTTQNKWNSSHLKRIVTAILGVLILTILIFCGTPLIFWLFITICIFIGLMEFYHLLAQNNIPCFRLVGLGLGLLVSVGFWLRDIPSLPAATVCLAVIIPFLISLIRPQDLSTVVPKLLGTIVGVFYVAWLLSHLIWIRGLPYGKAMIFFLLLIVWTGDTAAFYIGSFLGKHKLSPKISPKKTIEGAVAGVLGSIMAVIIAHFTFLKQISLGNSIFLGVVLNLLGQLGDLAESLLKRGSGVKDSGTLFPGHGGILDRIDSLLFAGPVLFYYISMYMYK